MCQQRGYSCARTVRHHSAASGDWAVASCELRRKHSPPAARRLHKGKSKRRAPFNTRCIIRSPPSPGPEPTYSFKRTFSPSPNHFLEPVQPSHCIAKRWRALSAFVEPTQQRIATYRYTHSPRCMLPLWTIGRPPS